MKARILVVLLAVLMVTSVLTSYGQMISRADAIWARTTTSAITVDGQLNEPAWAAAESVKIVYGIDNGMPGSGWFRENGLAAPLDSTRATVKFLVKADSLYVGIRVLDKSVGGGPFNHFDGTLSNLRRKDGTARPVQDGEIFYAWVKEPWADSLADSPGRLPFFGGAWGSSPYFPRPDSLKRIWDAATTVQGIQNNDTILDQGYTMEFKLNLKLRGYNVSQVAGDIIMYSFSIYDADYQWPLDTTRQAGNRVWFQCPWGNANAYNHIRIHARPDVGLTGGVPEIGPERIIPGAGSFASPVLDGRLTEPVWSAPNIGTLQIKFGDAAIRNAYPSTGPYRSGQFQPPVNGGLAAVVDPSLATVKYFYKNDTLFLGFDVNDLVVQSVDNLDRWDGFRIIICQRNARNGDNVLYPRLLSFRIGGSGTTVTAVRQDDLSSIGWDSLAQAVQVAMALKGGTTIDTLGSTPDSGYTAEMRVVLPRFGYPSGRGDGVLFFGAVFYDGDSFTPFTSSYGTRTWYMRERADNDGAAWCYMDPNITVGVDENGTVTPEQFALLGNYPNPFNPSTTIRFVLPQRSEVSLEVFNVLGQLVATQIFGEHQAGEHSVQFNAAKLGSGVYYYRLSMAATNASVVGKMMLLK